MAVNWVYETLPNVQLGMNGSLTLRPDLDFEDDKKKSHFDQYFNWRINEDTDEFVIRIARKPDVPRNGHINVDVKIDGGLTTQPDGSVRFDGGHDVAGVSKFALLFEISHESYPEVVDPDEDWDEPEEHEIKFFDHPEHKLRLAPENYYNDAVIDNTSYATCYACREPIASANARWVYECPFKPDCDYCVHATCALMARTIRHPSHLKHSLKLNKLDPGFLRECEVCRGKISSGQFYHCAKCDFDLHCKCPNPVDDGYASGDGTKAVPQAVPQTVPQAMPEAQYQPVAQAQYGAVGQTVPQAATPVLAPQIDPLERQMQLMQQQMEIQMQFNIAHQTAVNMANHGWAMSNLIG